MCSTEATSASSDDPRLPDEEIMRRTLPISNGVTLVLTQGELGYQPVLDTLDGAAVHGGDVQHLAA